MCHNHSSNHTRHLCSLITAQDFMLFVVPSGSDHDPYIAVILIPSFFISGKVDFRLAGATYYVPLRYVN